MREEQKKFFGKLDAAQGKYNLDIHKTDKLVNTKLVCSER